MDNTDKVEAKDIFVEKKFKPVATYKSPPKYSKDLEEEEAVFYWSRW